MMMSGGGGQRGDRCWLTATMMIVLLRTHRVGALGTDRSLVMALDDGRRVGFVARHTYQVVFLLLLLSSSSSSSSPWMFILTLFRIVQLGRNGHIHRWRKGTVPWTGRRMNR
uniref:Putative secreted protein n=1 Tax=Anopheles darlingi TaxID=43151 RepID=A0A2M4DIQ8_ANODA